MNSSPMISLSGTAKSTACFECRDSRGSLSSPSIGTLSFVRADRLPERRRRDHMAAWCPHGSARRVPRGGTPLGEGQMPASDISCLAIAEIAKRARLASHRGPATLKVGEEVLAGSAEFILPAEGGPVVAFSPGEALSNNFASDLRIRGNHEFGPFQIHCPVCYTRKPMVGVNDGWSLVSPINQPVTIEYGDSRPTTMVRALLNNFDYEVGDAVVSNGEFSRVGTPISVELSGRSAEFRRRYDHDELLSLVQAGLLRSATLTECAFDARGDSIGDLLRLAEDVATLCTFAAGATIGIAMLDCLDMTGAVVRRVVTQPVRSRYQSQPIIADFNLPRLFKESFAAHILMRRSQLPWRKLPTYCGSLEDLPYLEQKFAALMMAIEFFMRTCLLEGGMASAMVARLDFNELVGATRKHLRWDIPRHYAPGRTTRLLRNAVMHGGEVPTKDTSEFRLLFNKWRLFLFRRILIRIGYQGEVVSPHKGWESSSAVGDFSEEHNSFDSSEADSHPFARLAELLREFAPPPLRTR
jgi:hypothetical protein